jgi:hypothetical protein
MRHRLTISILMIAAFGAGLWARAAAQSKNDLSFLRSLPSARSVALGDAFVADVHDASSAQWNPAGLAFLESISLTGTQGYRADDRLARLVIGAPVWATENSTAAIAGEYASFDQADWSRGSGKMPGVEVSYALRLLRPFSVGVIYDYRNVQYQGAQFSSHSAGIGMMYSAFPSLMYGVSLTGLGSGIAARLQGDGHSLVLEKETNIPRIVTFGASWRYPATHDRPVLGLYLSNESITGESRLVYKLGAEIFPWKFLVIRGGIVSGPLTSVGRAGFGIHTSLVDIDYAMASSVAAERIHYLTVSINLPSH